MERRVLRREPLKVRCQWYGVVIACVLVAGVLGFGVWMLWESRPQTTVTTYPVEHENLIRKYARENGIEPAYVAAVIMAESSYRTDAVSSVNAQGLMQLLPSTGEWVAKKLNESYASGSLFDPETNLRYGCWYLGWLMERYDGSMKCASSAYHQGQGTVDKWLKNPDYSADGRTLKEIPSDATRSYVERILKYYEKYDEIYG